MKRLALSQDYFLETCTKLFTRMIDTVPRGVQLSEVITPVPVKPDNLVIAINESGDITFKGDIRVYFLNPLKLYRSRLTLSQIRTDDNPPTNSRQVLIQFKPRTPGTSAIPPVVAVKLPETTTAWHPHTPAFEWWNFTATVPVSQGLDSFTVEVINDGQSTVHTNGGDGFPLETDLIPQTQLSCGAVYMGRAYLLNLTVGVRPFLTQNLTPQTDLVTPHLLISS